MAITETKMNVQYVKTRLPLPRGFKVELFSTEQEVDAHLKGDAVRKVEIFNLYGQQKTALPNANDAFVTKLAEVSGFKPRLEPQKQVKNLKGELQWLDDAKTKPKLSSEQWAETEAEFVKRFISDVKSGKFTHEKFPKEEKALHEALQSVADATGVHKIDLTKAAQVAKGPKIKPVNLRRAESVFADLDKDNKPKAAKLDARIKKMVDIFTKEQVPFEPFNVPNDTDGNIKRLAAAIQYREDNKVESAYS